MKSKEYRTSPELLRNEFPTTEGCGMPILGEVQLPPVDSMLSYHDTRINDEKAKSTSYLVHFFKSDERFAGIYDSPRGAKSQKRLKKLAQYTAVCTPDFSLYPDMPEPIQLMQVFKNRWCGAFFEASGLQVIPTVTWAGKESFRFCFDGLPIKSTVAISTVGSKDYKSQFLLGYNKMLEVLQPTQIVCYGTAFEEMAGNLIVFPYQAFRGVK